MAKKVNAERHGALRPDTERNHRKKTRSSEGETRYRLAPELYIDRGRVKRIKDKDAQGHGGIHLLKEESIGRIPAV
jgi:hypothetical protein